jgi:hypothetical protein
MHYNLHAMLQLVKDHVMQQVEHATVMLDGLVMIVTQVYFGLNYIILTFKNNITHKIRSIYKTVRDEMKFYIVMNCLFFS